MIGIGRRTAAGASWAVLTFAVSRGLAFATNLILARLLSPADFGLVSFAMIFIGAFTLLQDLGISAAIIYNRRDVAVVGGTAFALNVGAATLLLGLTVVGAPFLGVAVGNPDVVPILMALAVGLVIAAFGSVQSALLVKELAFRSRFIPDAVPVILSGLASIGLALAGFGVWSLVIGYLARSLASTILLWWLSTVRVRLAVDWQIARELLSYGKHASVSSLIGFVLAALDQLIVGYLLGAAQLGLYVMAFNLASLPATALTEIAYRVAFPALAQVRDDPAARRRLLLDISTAIGALAVPVFIGIMICAPAFVAGVLGERWSGAVLVLQILALYGFQRCVYGPFNALFKAMGRPGIEAGYALLKLALSAPLMVWAALTYGIIGVAWVQAIVSAVLTIPPARTAARLAGVPARDMARLYLPQVGGIVLAAGAMSLAEHLPSDGSAVHGLLMALALAGLTATLYMAVFAAASPRLVGLVRRARGLVGRPAAQSTGVTA